MEKYKTKLFDIHSLRFRNDTLKLDQSSQNIYLNPIHLVPIEFFLRRNIYFFTTFPPKTSYFLRQEASTGTRNIASKENIERYKANITFCRGAQNNAEVSDKFKSKHFLEKVKSKSDYFHTTQKTIEK